MRLPITLLLLASLWSPAFALDDGDRSAIQGVIERQLDAFRRDDAASAYAHAAPIIQQRFAPEDAFMRMVREGYAPIYRSRSARFGELKDTALGPSQIVRVIDADGVAWTATYTFERQADASWKITGVYLERAPDETA